MEESMADAPSPAYDLRAPAAARGESITSQLQREIMGDAAVAAPTAESASASYDALSLGATTTTTSTTTPTRSTRSTVAVQALHQTPVNANDDNDLVEISTPEALSQPPSQSQSQNEVPATSTAPATSKSSDDRRRTLSPSKALAFFNQEGITDADVVSSRRDTVSPEAIRSMLRGLGDSDGINRRASVATASALDPTTDVMDEGVVNDALHGVERTKQFVDSSNKTLRQSNKRPRSSTGKNASSTTAATDQDSFTDAFFSTTLLSRNGGDDHENEDEDDENNTIDSISDTTGNRRATLEPMDAQSMLSELRSEMEGMTAQDRSPQDQAPASKRRTRQTPSPSPNTRSRKRRATIDPVDLMTMREGAAFESVAATVNANRRDTIGDGDLQELRREFGLEAGPSQDAKKRKSKSPSPAQQADATSKRTRFDGGEATTAPADADVRRSKATPVKATRTALDETDTLFSPPPTNRANKTPLKSCLSARKAKRHDQTTPNKSVNFGPSQGAEFNLGSPSTSMTPMPARAARVRFPLEEKPPQASDEDEETSLNSSILDEIDEQKSSDDEGESVAAAQHKLSIEPSVSTRRRRGYTGRGVSPLDNQAKARLQRRQSVLPTSTQQPSPLVSARNRRAFEAAATVAAVAASTSSSRGSAKTAFMSSSDPTPQSRLAFHDSSASSDEGEDMEITGDYTNQAATAATLNSGVRRSRLSESPRRSTRVSARQDSLFVDSPLADETVELGTLHNLVAENYEEEKNQESQVSDLLEEDDEIPMSMLSDLAREGADADNQQRFGAKSTGSQDANLHPIVEGDDEDRRSSSAHSMMSLDSDESDDEYDKKRKSLVVNLSSKFERFGSGSPKQRKPRDKNQAQLYPKALPATMASPVNKPSPSRALPTPSPAKLPDPLRIEEVLARVQLDSISKETVERVDVGVLVTDVQRSCLAQAALSNLRFSANEVASWCSGLADSIPTLEREKVSRLFTNEDSTTQTRINESIQSLQAIENLHVRSGYCHWRSKVEKTICDGLVQCENRLISDARALRSMLESDRSHRESELRAMKDLMERERQMEQLLDGIEEQQAVQREYQSSVQQLESDCSSLSLEASVLDQQLVSIEHSSPQTDLSQAAESKLRREVLELEELLAVRESVGMWSVQAATGSKLSIISLFDDVFFSIEVRVLVDITSPSSDSTFKVTPVFTTKTRRKTAIVEPQAEDDEDAVSVIAALILSKQQLQRFELNSLGADQLSSQLGLLSTTLRRAYQYLSDLRSISTQCRVRVEAIDEVDHRLWIDFVRFPRVLPNADVVDGVKFSVGHYLELSWPYTDFDQQVQISYGTLTEEKLQQQLDGVSTQSGHDYLLRTCQMLRDVFIHDV